MTIRARILWLGLVGACASVAFSADQPVAAADPRIELAKKIPGTTPDELHATPIPGIYELVHGTEIAYVTADGKYAISGDLYDLGRNDNLTEVRRRDIRMKLLASVPESDMLIFSPRDPKYTVTVFTDVDCAYCRKLHSQIAEYNRLGVRVRYMFYPRSGPNTESWTKAEQVWCSTNRNEALTRAKLGEELKSPKSCGNSPVSRDYEMGQQFDIRGTPAIVMKNGEMLGGYVSPMQLVQHLQGK
ncbi:MAG TPA: DsbC family protein [Steroidobacteraceae bacterium]|jgi:thiol:disulfide interchange protein DsbC|nr:DsbC family protein [Steroidobacteraceae bacterium]